MNHKELFSKETTTYNKAIDIIKNNAASETVLNALKELAEQYNQLLRRSISLMKSSDSFQNELRKSNAQLEKAQKTHEIELEMARRIQQHLLPLSPPKIPSINLFSEYLALHQVGGDFIDYYDAGSGIYGILVADASGHGIPAALVSSMSKIALESLRHEASDPVALLTSLSNAILNKIENHYVTACYSIINTQNNELIYSIAGHPPPILLRQKQHAVQLPGEGTYLGIFSDLDLQEWRYQLEPGDRVLIITDGILDCINENGDFFSYEQLLALFTDLGTRQDSEILPALIDALREYSSSSNFSDDVTLLLLTLNQ